MPLYWEMTVKCANQCLLLQWRFFFFLIEAEQVQGNIPSHKTSVSNSKLGFKFESYFKIHCILNVFLSVPTIHFWYFHLACYTVLFENLSNLDNEDTVQSWQMKWQDSGSHWQLGTMCLIEPEIPHVVDFIEQLRGTTRRTQGKVFFFFFQYLGHLSLDVYKAKLKKK